MLPLIPVRPTQTGTSPARGSRRRLLAVGSGAVILAMAVLVGLAPPTLPSEAQRIAAYNATYGQSFKVSHRAEVPTTETDGYGATPGVESLRRSGTNRDWAQLVLLFASWPQTEASITVILRWMRQENAPESWWLRNNPLNNGWGAEGGTFLGGNPDLVDAARDVADALTSNPGYAGIADAFENGASAAAIEQAIWHSPWATGHYDYGGHWSSADPRIITAPPSAWGL